jgi:hypothetical protein
MSGSQIIKTIAAVILLLMLSLAACGTTMEETPIPPTATRPPPTDTPTPIPPTPTITPIPPTDTPTSVPPTPTVTAIPADQGPITLDIYQINILGAWVVEGVLVPERDIYTTGGPSILPIEMDPNSNTLMVTIRLVSGKVSSFTDYGCQVLEPDGGLKPIEKIQAWEGEIYWFVSLSSADSNLMVYCPEGILIDLAPLLVED